MKSPAQNKKNDLFTEALFYLLVFASITCFAAVQAFGDPPDEINRFKVVSYICRHGRLPHGADPEIILDGYGASYAFQPILTYIMQGFLLRFINLFTEDSYVLLLAARLVNAVFGVLMAYFVRQTAKEIWKSRYLQWLFTIMVVFLPQNIFIHSYVNTDSMAMLSVSVICYALLRAQRTDYEKKDCILLATGIILCALSYYNAYGIILAAVLIFLSHYIHAGKIEWAPMLRKGLFISAIVLAGIGWWFIRNGILYDGDILALNARSECAMQTAIPELHPLTRVTFQNSGRSLSDMLFGAHYILLVSNSFIAMFGPLLIPTHRLIYVFYRFFWLLASSAALLIPGSLWFSGTDSPWNSRKESLSKSEKSRKAFSCGCMLPDHHRSRCFLFLQLGFPTPGTLHTADPDPLYVSCGTGCPKNMRRAPEGISPGRKFLSGKEEPLFYRKKRHRTWEVIVPWHYSFHTCFFLLQPFYHSLGILQSESESLSTV